MDRFGYNFDSFVSGKEAHLFEKARQDEIRQKDNYKFNAERHFKSGLWVKRS